jgi:hypothetical protein
MTTADITNPATQVQRRLSRIKHINQEIESLRDKEQILQYEIIKIIRENSP